MATHRLDIIKALEVHTTGKDGDFIAVNHFTKEGDLLFNRTTFRIFFHASIWCLFYLLAKFLEVIHRKTI
jgi:hypothetical protein